MNNLDKVGESSHIGYKSSPVEEGLINKALPIEIFEKVLSYLNGREIQEANLVSHLWNKLSIDTSKYEEFSKIKNFVNFLSANLKEESYAKLKEQLLGISSEAEILNSVNLIQVKSSIYDLKEMVLNILKDLSENDLKNLKKLSKNETKPKFFEDFFDLASIYKKIDNANQMPAGSERNKALQAISEELTHGGNVDNALEIANTISEVFARNKALVRMSGILTQYDNFDKAIDIANMVPYFVKKSILHHVSMALTEKGNFDKALDIANMMPEGSLRNDAFERISRALTEDGKFDKAKYNI